MLYDEDMGVFWPLGVYLEHNRNKTRSDVAKNLVAFKGEDGRRDNPVGIDSAERHSEPDRMRQNDEVVDERNFEDS